MNEFSLIDQFFKPLSFARDDILLGIGDDAACLQLNPGMNLLVSTDTLVSGVHFLPEWSAYDIASRAVRVNISDLAAMAAQPCWLTLALTLPEIESHWLAGFAQGLKDSMAEFQVSLVGGDTTKGPFTINLTVFGQAPYGQEVRRTGAQPGDVIMVSGTLGAAALSVELLQSEGKKATIDSALLNKLIHPQPRVDLMPFLRDYATAAIDISDGLSADLNHICVASQVGACLDKQSIPIHPLVLQYQSFNKAIDLALRGGDDYELCFTVRANQVEALNQDLKKAGLLCYPVGTIEEKKGLRIKSDTNICEELTPQGYKHFY